VTLNTALGVFALMNNYTSCLIHYLIDSFNFLGLRVIVGQAMIYLPNKRDKLRYHLCKFSKTISKTIFFPIESTLSLFGHLGFRVIGSGLTGDYLRLSKPSELPRTLFQGHPQAIHIADQKSPNSPDMLWDSRHH